MNRIIRYQGAIVRDDHILLIRYLRHDNDQTYWLFPGGGIEAGETEEECVQREMHEETNLRVSVGRLLLNLEAESGQFYPRRKTFLCSVVSGVAAPGYEPEETVPPGYGIVEVRWFDLRDERRWPLIVREDSITYPQLRAVQQALGYSAGAKDAEVSFDNDLVYDYVESPIGLVEICCSPRGVAGLNFVESLGQPLIRTSLHVAVGEQISAYFAGELRRFDLPLDLHGTEFQRRVWAQLLTVPYGETASYLDVALALGDPKSIRAVGAANGRNPVSIVVPCHRIIGSDGKLIGYGGGLWRKEWLLRHEGALLI